MTIYKNHSWRRPSEDTKVVIRAIFNFSILVKKEKAVLEIEVIKYTRGESRLNAA